MDGSGTRGPLVLAGDIGGSKTVLGLFVKGKGRACLKEGETFSSREFRDLEGIIRRFLERHPVSVEAWFNTVCHQQIEPAIPSQLQPFSAGNAKVAGVCPGGLFGGLVRIECDVPSK